MSEKELIFDHINTISNERLQQFVLEVMSKVPETFWTIPASSSGKHHPPQSNGEGGLVRHTLACLYFAREFAIAYSLSTHQINILKAGLIMHDIGKAIAEPHDCTGTRFISWIAEEFNSDDVDEAISLVRWHMGRWSTGSTHCLKYEQGHKIFPQCFTLLEQIAHLCDYAASRKRIELSKLEA